MNSPTGHARWTGWALVALACLVLGAPAHAQGSSRSVRARHRGQRISVAIIDSGVQPHADLPASRIRAFVDFVNGRTRPYDDFGHGSHVAGILAGSGVASSLLDQPLPSDEIFGEHVAWAKNIVWGERMLLGESVYVRMVVVILTGGGR